ncbi:MAG: hypothetical protein HOL15_07435 [Nitrospinaceae bacterium]|jgi:hypothetical protein|nr:hypothetical protein [Nitrospina sp.]MBT5376629.1 hypothetical protein [Nitrospinaceae bacterium]MBT5867823.1 hypothetical protein [Nitrospinaceae bacterium]MBT6346014.1 hypothetical protein [Nitrospina sp.]
MKKTVVALLALCFASVSVASANVSIVKAGDSSTCLRASWVIENASETAETTVHINVGAIAYAWDKNFDRNLMPGGFLANSLEEKTTFKNKGPAAITVNCQAHRVESASRVEWKRDAGSHKTYQNNYHLDHVRPGTYVEPGMGQPEGTERGLFSQNGSASGGGTSEAHR